MICSQPATSCESHFCPFDLNDDAAYRVWRNRKIETEPRRPEELIVEVSDPRKLTDAEREAILSRCRTANMAIYAGRTGDDPDKKIPEVLGRQLGLIRLDHNWLADEDAITPLAVDLSGHRPGYIPYTNRPMKWHTDGYYNRPDRQVRGLILHCVQPAASGGVNRLMDHEMAYIFLRDANPDYIRALMQPDAMTVPARVQVGQVKRAAQTGPVFSVHPGTGDLHMRYTARRHNIQWKDEPTVVEAVHFLEDLLARESASMFRVRLESGMGLISNNVLHDRSGFEDIPGQPARLLYRARYYDRLQGTGVRDLYSGG
jgi:hypothetical protein